MRILYYISQLRDNDLRSDYVRMSMEALKDAADVFLATRTSNIKQVLGESSPDIVHIHSCWDHTACKLMKAAASLNVGIVITPHSEIGTYAMRQEEHLRKTAKNAAYQKWMISHADAVLATTEYEEQDLKKLGWQKRIDTIGSALTDSKISPESMAEKLMWLYNKVIDTRYRTQMTDNEKEAVRSLVHVGMAHDEAIPLLDSKQILNLRALKPREWRRILLYADDEDLRTIIDNAATRMLLTIPDIDTSKISRYPTEHPKAMGKIPSEKPVEWSRVMGRKIAEATSEQPEELKSIATELVNARTLLKRRKMSMRHLAELYEDIKYIDYDESILVDIAKELKIRPFMRRMLSVLAKECYLEEGFMPDKPLDDKTARRIAKQFI